MEHYELKTQKKSKNKNKNLEIIYNNGKNNQNIRWYWNLKKKDQHADCNAISTNDINRYLMKGAWYKKSVKLS